MMVLSPRSLVVPILCSLLLFGCGGSGSANGDDPTASPAAQKKSAKKGASVSGTSSSQSTSARFIPPPEAVTPKQLIDKDTLVWRASRPLSWSDYHATQTGTNDSTRTVVEIYALPVPGSSNARWNVQALFFRARSVPVQQHRRTAELLAHEQLHFDIAELYARDLRRYVDGLHGTNDAETRDSFYRKFDDLRVRLESENRRYDLETKYGADEPAQAGWAGDVARRLVGANVRR